MTARVVCLVALVAAVARAQPEHRRPVAVIDLSRDEAAKKLRFDIEGVLGSHWALRLPPNRFDSALEGELIDEDSGFVAGASLDAKEAEEANAQFEIERARRRAKDGLDKLTNAGPTAAAGLRADLAFALGIAELSRDKKAAAAAFALAARLDPMRRPDPARYMDEYVRAFDAAKAAPVTKVALSIAGAGHVWIDGLLVGTSPGTFQVTTGLHLVQLADLDRETRGVVVPAPGPTVAIPPAPASDDLQVRRTRAALAHAPDATARAGALAKLAELIDVHDVVLIEKNATGKLMTQTVTQRDGALAYSKPREYIKGVTPDDILEPLSGPKPVPDEPKEPPRPPVKPNKDPVGSHENEPKWYRQRWVLPVSIGTGVVATALTIFLVVSQQHYVTTAMKGQFPPP